MLDAESAVYRAADSRLLDGRSAPSEDQEQLSQRSCRLHARVVAPESTEPSAPHPPACTSVALQGTPGLMARTLRRPSKSPATQQSYRDCALHIYQLTDLGQLLSLSSSAPADWPCCLAQHMSVIAVHTLPPHYSVYAEPVLRRARGSVSPEGRTPVWH